MLALLPAHPAIAQQGVGGQASSPIIIEPPVRDFGRIEPGSKHPATFLIRNATRNPLRIKAAMPSCKCTATNNIAGKVIPPGGFVELQATLDAPNTPGVKNATIQLVFDGLNKPFAATLKGEVVMPVLATPPYVDALKGVTSGSITLTSADGSPFSVLSSDGKPPQFIGFNPATDAPRNQYVVKWSIAGMPCQGMKRWWIFTTDRADCPVIPCRIRNECTGSKADMARFQRFWIFQELIVNAGLIRSGRPVVLTADIDHYNPRERGRVSNPGFRNVISVRSLSPEATAELVSSKPVGQEEAKVTFKLTPRAGFTGPLFARVLVTTATGSGEIPVVARVVDGSP